MMEKLTEALEELKRVDHLIYVSLKYTRTVDVILNILNRMVDAYSLIIDALIAFAEEKGKVLSEPESAVERAQLVKAIFHDDDVISDNMMLYLLLRKLLRARNIERENEYRRHVTMKTIIEGREEIVNIDIITNYYLYLREFIIHSKSIIEGSVEVIVHVQEFASPSEPGWMREEKKDREEEHVLEETPLPVKTSPVRSTVKVRPVTSPPRKRSPRPKKYKIQIPKGKNPIMRPPYEHDPKYNRELREKLAEQEREKAAQSIAVKKAPAKKKAAPKRKAPARRPAGKAAKKAARKAVKKAPKKSAKKSARKRR